ncbi:MAG: hypothetical protein HFI72_06650 [Peptococcaceae bacterium]|nr:hypothetical protein [Peptococcaceae bacterium]
MMWWLWILFIFICIVLLLLPLKVRLTFGQGEEGLSGHLYILVWKKIVWQKQYDSTMWMQKKKQHQTDKAGAKKQTMFSRIMPKIIAAAKEEWSALLAIAMRNITIEEWRLFGSLSTDYPAVKGIFCGVLSSVIWWVYGSSQHLLIWKKRPVVQMRFGSDTNWQFQCMIKSNMGQIIGKGINMLRICIKRSVRNGAKERNRNAHANGYL